MKVSKRTFLIGLAATLASPAIAKSEIFTGPISTGTLHSALKYRRICDFTLSCMPTGEELRAGWVEDPVRFTLLRNNTEIYAVTINPRATVRWVSLPGAEIEFGELDIFRIEVEPNYTFTTVNIISNIERNHSAPPKMFSEVFRWKDGRVEIDSTAALSLENAKLLA